MSESRYVNPFSALILVVSLVGIILLLVTDFAGFYYTGYGNRYSCLTGCEYYSIGDLISQIFILIFLLIQIVIVIDDLLPNKFIAKDLTKFGIGFAALTMLFAIIGIASFGVEWGNYEWWPEAGFYGSIFSGLINIILFFLSSRRR